MPATNRLRDAQGQDLSGATPEAIAAFDDAVRALTLSYGDANALFDKAAKAAPHFVMAHLGKAWVLALANDPQFAAKARPLLARVADVAMNERERAHLAAIGHAIDGHRAAGTAILDRHLMAYPFDLLGHMGALVLDAFQGRFPQVAGRSARALPRWSKSQPGYGSLLAFHGFGLEEACDFVRAEDVSRQAAELEPHGYWSHHAVSHVLEMTGRPQEGLAWMDARTSLWSGDKNASRVHIWWHKALFHVELGQYAEALAIYDGPVHETQRPAGVSLTNSSALLWRLETLGCEAGDRWQTLAGLWRGHADGKLCLFADVHAAMAALKADDRATLDELRAAMRRTAASGTESAPVYRDIGLPVVAALEAFHRGDDRTTVETLLPLRAELRHIGGSMAQRDVIEWTLTEAAVRAGMRDVAASLAYERLDARPASAPNKRFLARAEAIG